MATKKPQPTKKAPPAAPARRRGAGRPTLLTQETTDRLLSALRAGNFRNVAAEWAGISDRVFREWMAKGEASRRGPFVDFRRRVLEAERAAEIRAVGLVMKAAEEDPKHAEWWLERKFPERWGRRDKMEVSGSGGGPIQLGSGDSLMAYLRKLEGGGSATPPAGGGHGR